MTPTSKTRSTLLPEFLARKPARLASCVLLALGLGGCATTMDFSSWVVNYNTSVEQQQNRLTLLNILRAADDMPLTFTAVLVVRGQGSTAASAQVGLSRSDTSTSVTGVAGSQDTISKAFAPGASLQVSSGFQFDTVVLDNMEFYAGLLTPIGIDALHSLSKRGVPPELILSLMVDRITLTLAGKTETFVNDPTHPSYAQFRQTLVNLLRFGLTTELVSSSAPLSPLLNEAEIKANMKMVFDAAAAGIFLTPEPGGARFVKRNTAARICFTGGPPEMPPVPQTSLCESSPKRVAAPKTLAAPQADPNAIATQDTNMVIATRSTREVFNYLGRLVSRQTTGNLDVTLDSAEAAAYRGGTKGRSLFRVVKDQGKGDDLVSVGYRGTTYSVPNDQQGYSATVLMVLQQFLTLSKAINSMPPTGSVVVR